MNYELLCKLKSVEVMGYSRLREWTRSGSESLLSPFTYLLNLSVLLTKESNIYLYFGLMTTFGSV